MGVGTCRVVINVRSGVVCRTGCSTWGVYYVKSGVLCQVSFLPLSYAPSERSYASVLHVGSPMHGFLLQACYSCGSERRAVDGSVA